MKFATNHPGDPANMLKSMLVSDETKAELFGLNAKDFVRQIINTAPSYILLTVNYGHVSIMLCGCFCQEWTGKLIGVDKKMNRAKNMENIEEIESQKDLDMQRRVSLG